LSFLRDFEDGRSQLATALARTAAILTLLSEKQRNQPNYCILYHRTNWFDPAIRMKVYRVRLNCWNINRQEEEMLEDPKTMEGVILNLHRERANWPKP